jgi:pimeloyl-ACP methyl ester carboxylesterase
MVKTRLKRRLSSICAHVADVRGARLVLTGALLGAAGALGAQMPENRWPDDVRKCELSAAAGRVTASALCGTLEVPEDRDAPDGTRIELAWAVIEARSSQPEPDPVFFLAGGPGQSARDTAPLIQRYLDDVNRTRDLIFLDQRGTGGSNSLDCELDDELFLTEPDLDQIDALLRDCRQRLDADLRHYTTLDAVADLDALRTHLGLDRINLVGGSYGTRVAQVYLREHPDAVRSMVLDGIVPMRLALGAEHAQKLDQTIDRLLAGCAGDEACSERFPDLDQAFADLKASYGENPRTIQVTDPRTGVAQELEFSQPVLASSLRFLAYSPVTQMMIPYLIHEAATTGSPERLAAQALMTSSEMSEQIAIGLNFSVGCAEDWPHWPDDTGSAGTLLGDSFTELYSRVCAWWPADPVSSDFHDPVASEVPTLLLSGELDPVTPPEYGDETADQFANGRHIVAEGRGHIVMSNPCIASIITEFVTGAGVEDLDDECVDAIGREPFFLSLLGPSP